MVFEEYLVKAGGSPTMAAVLMGRDLMRGNPATLKQGYTAPNAALVAVKWFDGADVEVVSQILAEVELSLGASDN